MKTKKLLLFSLSLFTVFGCKDKEPRYEIYENHEITACEIKDPLKNQTWLGEFIERNMDSPYNITIYVYSNTETNEENIVINTDPIGEGNSDAPPNYCFWIKAYSCSGIQLFVNESGDIDCESWNNFFYSGQNSIKGTIWYRKISY